MVVNKKEIAATISFLANTDPKKCMRCGKCSASCPSFGEMNFHPHQFVAMVAKGEIGPLLNDATITKCLTCFACVERCPRGIAPANLIETIRVFKMCGTRTSYLKPEDVPEMLDDEMPQQALMAAFRKYRK